MKQIQEVKEAKRDLSWVKGLLNNLPLLKWVKKFSADNLLIDNTLANKFGIATTDNSISILDKSRVKLLVTDGKYNGEELASFNAKHLFEVLREITSEATLIVGKTDNSEAELFLQSGNNVIVIASMGKGDKDE